jgi:DNA-binding MarR family transcriptional regulator
MLVLADVAEVGTAEIPARFTPSLVVLAAETGLDRRTVQRHLAALEESGWLVRTRPSPAEQWIGERVRYRLTVPDRVAAEDRHPVAAEGQLAAEDRQPGGTEPPGVAAQSHIGGGTEPPLEADPSEQNQIEVRSLSSAKKGIAIPDRIDVEMVCRHLADRIEANGSKRPTITETWHDAARRLIDRDGRTVEQIVKAIDWCQDDDFWRGNILSMPKLRAQYDRLRLAAARTNGHKPSTSDQRVLAAQALKAKFAGGAS